MRRDASTARLSTIPARRLASLLVLMHLVACGTDSTATTAATATTTSADQTDGPGTTADPPTTGDPAPATTSTADPTTSSTTSSTTAGASASASGDLSTTTADLDTTTDTTLDATGPAGSSTTGAEPPPDPCADQDDPPPGLGDPDGINDDPRFIQVYVNNVENLKIAGEQCPGDWTDLIYYMKSIDPSPDLFLVQQISDTAQLDALVQRMTDDLPGIYEGIIADEDPWDQLSPCGKEKARQTNAIIFRQGRFDELGDRHVWQSWANKGGECVRNNQARTRNVMIKLHDKIADRDVTVAALHWSTSQGDGPDPACAAANIAEADQKVHKNGFGGDLVIFGGDFNEPDRKDNDDPRPWYAQANGDGGGELNYRDPIYRACQAARGLQACLDDNWTIGGDRRIDMLFAQDGDGCRARTDRAHTITFNEAEAAAKDISGDSDPDLNYSEHRGVRALFFY